MSLSTFSLGEEAVHEGEKLQPDLILIEFSLPWDQRDRSAARENT